MSPSRRTIAKRVSGSRASSGAKIWYDLELDELHWPLLLLYPEVAQSDFVQDFAEPEPLKKESVSMFDEVIAMMGVDIK